MAQGNLGMVHVYTGNNKGKTTTSMGIALRAAGQNLKVCIIQFLKGGSYTGEYIAIKNFLPNIKIHQYGKPCIKEQRQLKLNGFDSEKENFPMHFVRDNIECGDCRHCFLADEEEKAMAFEAVEHAKKASSSGEYDIVILDEINNSLQKEIIPPSSVIRMIDNKAPETELILTGRGAPQEIIEKADLVTEMNLVRHYFDKGVPARRGVEY
ncbi:MAG: cob(I)yrinic acid a,c-diamide adenosyltransferase [Candidatus Woesearchaeota archaeon]